MPHQSKEERVHHVFEKIYDKYDTMNSIISFHRHKAWRNDVMKRMDVQKGSTALDVCCGTGDWSIALAKAAGKSGSVIGLDFSENMLSVAREKGENLNEGNLDFILANAMELPFPDESFDYVSIGFGWRDVPDYFTVVKEMQRVAKPGGKVVCLETSQPTLFGYRHLFYFYFRFIMPLFGKLFAKSFKEYAWLHESAKDFPDKHKLKQLFLDAGFTRVEVKSYTGGVAAMHMAFK